MKAIKNFYEFDGKDYGYRRWQKNAVARFDYDATKRAVVNFLKNKELNSVLEVGCGPGTWTSFLAEHSKKVTAIDISSTMLEQAREKIKSKNVTFVNGDISELIIKEKFDLLFSIRAFEYFDKQEAFIMNSFNLLNDGGEIFIITKTKGSYWYGRSKIRSVLKKIFPFLFYYETKELSKKHFDNLANFEQNRLFTHEMKALLKKAGFQDIKIRPVIVRPPIFMRGKSEIPIIPPFLEKLVLLLLKPFDRLLSHFSVFTIFAESFLISGKRR